MHDLTLLEIGYSFDRLYAGNDPDYLLALSVVRDRVADTRHEASERAKAGGA